jgi:hypothetical protein
MDNTYIAPTQSKPQKSTAWLWTTLWLTATIDSFFIALMLYLLVAVSGFLRGTSPIFATLIFDLIILIATAIGSVLAARYVLKRSVVLKASAGKFAGLAILIPLIGAFGLRIYALTQNTTASVGDIAVSFISTAIWLAIVYGIIHHQISTRGD